MRTDKAINMTQDIRSASSYTDAQKILEQFEAETVEKTKEKYESLMKVAAGYSHARALENVTATYQKACAWLLGDDAGVSSKTIWAMMMGLSDAFMDADLPYDPSDFGRCYRLLTLFPEWKPRLGEVAEKFPGWGPFVEKWDTLTELYEKRSPELYPLMKSLCP